MGQITITCNSFWCNFYICTVLMGGCYGNTLLGIKFTLNSDFTIILPIMRAKNTV